MIPFSRDITMLSLLKAIFAIVFIDTPLARGFRHWLITPFSRRSHWKFTAADISIIAIADIAAWYYADYRPSFHIDFFAISPLRRHCQLSDFRRLSLAFIDRCLPYFRIFSLRYLLQLFLRRASDSFAKAFFAWPFHYSSSCPFLLLRYCISVFSFTDSHAIEASLMSRWRRPSSYDTLFLFAAFADTPWVSSAASARLIADSRFRRSHIFRQRATSQHGCFRL